MTRTDPLDDLAAECDAIASNGQLAEELGKYLDGNPIIEESLDTLLAQLAMVAGARWQDVAEVLRPLARRGWHIGRWLPTFLLVDGPLGRLLRDSASPLNRYLRTQHVACPMLAEARDALSSDFFRRVRNGFAHWSFHWTDDAAAKTSWITIINWETGREEERLTLLDAEALHLFAFTVIETLDKKLLRRIRAEVGARSSRLARPEQ